jgi:FkbM family methyltransferase
MSIKKGSVPMLKNKDLWTYLQKSDKKILMYGMGNGADKILAICASYGIEVCDFFASDGFVRGHFFHGKRVLSYTEACEKYGRENMIVLLSFASSLPDVLANIYRIADECELYAPDVPVCGENLFNYEFYKENEDKIRRAELLLADMRSVEVFGDVINYKLSGNVELLRGGHSDFSEVYRLLGAEDFEKIADLGAYNGDTAQELTELCPNIDKIIALEPDRRNFRKLAAFAENDPRVIPVNAAAWKENTKLIFDDSGNRNAGLDDGSSRRHAEVDAIALDSILNSKVDYIKYDVEGAEKEAIEGTKETIKKYHPDLLISVYHRTEDLHELILLIHSIAPEYKLFLRRYPYIPAWDLNLYAIKE